MFFEKIWEALLHALTELPFIFLFLFLSYLLLEFFEHRAKERTYKLIQRAGRLGPLAGGLIGAVPQCGFSAAAAGLYSGGIITKGTLIAVFLSASDEMLPIMIAGVAEGTVDPFTILKIVGLKIIFGILAGFAVDLIFRGGARHSGHIGEICEKEGCNCGADGVIIPALKHALKVSFFVLLTTFAINLAVVFVGEENLSFIFSSVPVLGEMIAALIGLIPNCASSAIITELYIGGAITASQMMAGLFVGAGVGLLVLFRTNRSLKDSLFVLLTLYTSGVLLSLIVGALGIL